MRLMWMLNPPAVSLLAFSACQVSPSDCHVPGRVLSIFLFLFPRLVSHFARWSFCFRTVSFHVLRLAVRKSRFVGSIPACFTSLSQKCGVVLIFVFCFEICSISGNHIARFTGLCWSVLRKCPILWRLLCSILTCRDFIPRLFRKSCMFVRLLSIASFLLLLPIGSVYPTLH